MAFEKKIILNADKIKDMKTEGSTIEGYYIGRKVLPSGSLHVFNTEEGNVGIWGARMLDDLLGTVTPGELTKVTYIEKKSLGNGKSMKLYDVESDKENTISVTAVSQGTNTSYSEAADDADGSDELFDDAATAEPVQRGSAKATAAAANTAKAFFRKK